MAEKESKLKYSDGDNQSCLNCAKQAQTGDVYCSQCAQKLITSKLSVKRLLVDFITNFFDWDSRLFLTVYKIIFPSRLTKEYIQGKRKKYLNPARIFLFSLIIFFALLSMNIDTSQLDINDNNVEKKVAKAELLNVYDSLRIQHEGQANPILDSIREALFRDVKPLEEDTLTIYDDQTLLGIKFKPFKIVRKDLLELTPAQILEKYEIKEFQNRLAARQTVRVYKNPEGSIRFVIGNMLWGFFGLVFILAALMKLLYIRHNYFYVEHLIFQFHFHSFTFLFLSFFSLDQLIFGKDSLPQWVSALLGIVILFYYFIAIKKYYNQGILKTGIKFLILNISYFFIWILLSILVLIISMIIF